MELLDDKSGHIAQVFHFLSEVYFAIVYCVQADTLDLPTLFLIIVLIC